MKNSRRIHSFYILAGAAALAAIAVYLPVLRNGFVNWDDDIYVYNNLHIRSLDPSFLRWAFSSISVVYWQPLTWLSHAVDYALWGLNPLGHHLTSILLHGLNAFLVVLLVLRLFEAARESRLRSGRPPLLDERSVLIAAGVTGLLFGIHPLHVESVAWVSERKDLLYALFFLLSTMAYLRFVSGRGEGGVRPQAGALLRDRWYLLTLFLFALSLASKPMAVTLPLVLVLLDWYPLDRVRTLRDLRASVAEKLPFFGLSLAVAVVTVHAQHAGGVMPSLATVSLPTRLLVAGGALIAYLVKMAAPLRLPPLVLHPGEIPLLSLPYLFSCVLAAGITAACIAAAKKEKVWLAVWGFYVLNLLPVLGIFQAGAQAMADRFTYLAVLGPLLLAGTGAARLWYRAAAFRKGRRMLARGIFAAGAVSFLLFLSVLAVRQIGVWKSGISFWTRVIETVPQPFPQAYNSRGIAYFEAGRMEQALSDFNSAIALKPDYTDAYTSRAWTWREMGRPEAAVRDLNEAIRLDPDDVIAYNDRGILFLDGGRYARAIDDFTVAIVLQADFAEAYAHRGRAYAWSGRPDLALRDLDRAIELDPANGGAFLDRGDCLRAAGNRERALRDYRTACGLGNDKGCSAVRSATTRGITVQ